MEFLYKGLIIAIFLVFSVVTLTAACPTEGTVCAMYHEEFNRSDGSFKVQFCWWKRQDGQWIHEHCAEPLNEYDTKYYKEHREGLKKLTDECFHHGTMPTRERMPKKDTISR